MYYLAQINIATFMKPVDDPVNQDFVNNLERVNASENGLPIPEST